MMLSGDLTVLCLDMPHEMATKYAYCIYVNTYTYVHNAHT